MVSTGTIWKIVICLQQVLRWNIWPCCKILQPRLSLSFFYFYFLPLSLLRKQCEFLHFWFSLFFTFTTSPWAENIYIFVNEKPTYSFTLYALCYHFNIYILFIIIIFTINFIPDFYCNHLPFYYLKMIIFYYLKGIIYLHSSYLLSIFYYLNCPF